MLFVSSYVKQLIKISVRKNETLSNELRLIIVYDLLAKEAYYSYTHKNYIESHVTDKRVEAEWGREAKAFRVEQAQRAKLKKDSLQPTLINRIIDRTSVANTYINRLEIQFLEALRNGTSLEDAAQVLANYIVKTSKL
jgi:hypothetical protein